MGPELDDKSEFYIKNAKYWVVQLERMYHNHFPELDHKDCNDIADTLRFFIERGEAGRDGKEKEAGGRK